MAGKKNDGESSRLDMQLLDIHSSLTFIPYPDSVYLSPPSRMLSKDEKIKRMKWLHEARVPYGYSSNILTKVKLDGYKVLDPVILDDFQKDNVFTLCLLEMHFPPSFFDVIIHLSVHLVRKATLCGPVFARWMYPFERFMRVLKGYVCNGNILEASMVEANIAEKVIEFCFDVLSFLPPIGIPERHNDSVMGGFALLVANVHDFNIDLLSRAHHCVLVNNDPITPYVNGHIQMLEERAQYLGKGAQ